IEADVKQRVNDQAKERAEGMTEKLHDVLEEGGLREALEDFIEDFVTYPVAVLKGPVYRRMPKIEWGPNWQLQDVEELHVQVERVSPFDIYPTPDAESINDGEFIERIRMTRKQVHDLIGSDGYDSGAIRRVLED